ncbi:hypothetical protein NUU61_003930 [Penicillium alfredii]|uniref:Uncharacterized protein n=1 Tax=Penicillium alfredii TaxID=1506179 RepID=A0A9W9FK55_9EURO|nr:uncharacterized protein NUU61_003930 [Penicillium alfredii]KAJ5101708.1 hypothetical protein NUU61_003930 [Penicillium alfredii]
MDNQTSQYQGDQQYRMALDATNNVQETPGAGGTDWKSADHVLRLETHNWWESSPSLFSLRVLPEETRDVIFSAGLNKQTKALLFDFKLPADHPDGRLGLLRLIKRLFDGTSPLGITATHIGQAAIEEFIGGIKKVRKRSHEWRGPTAVVGCQVEWMRRPEKEAPVHIRFEVDADEAVVFTVDKGNSEYVAATEDRPLSFIDIMTLPVRIWLRTRYCIDHFNSTLKGLQVGEEAKRTEEQKAAAVPAGECLQADLETSERAETQHITSEIEQLAVNKETAPSKLLQRLKARQKEIGRQEARLARIQSRSARQDSELKRQLANRQTATEMVEKDLMDCFWTPPASGLDSHSHSGVPGPAEGEKKDERSAAESRRNAEQSSSAQGSIVAFHASEVGQIVAAQSTACSIFQTALTYAPTSPVSPSISVTFGTPPLRSQDSVSNVGDRESSSPEAADSASQSGKSNPPHFALHPHYNLR